MNKQQIHKRVSPEAIARVLRDWNDGRITTQMAKPALGAYMTFVDARPAGSVQACGEWRSADGKTYFPQWTRPDGRKAGMIWTVGGERNMEVTFSSWKMEFLDASGAKVRPSRRNRTFSLKVTDSPLYFFGGELRR